MDTPSPDAILRTCEYWLGIGLVGYGSSVSIVQGTSIVLIGDRYWTGPSGIQSGQVYVYSVH